MVVIGDCRRETGLSFDPASLQLSLVELTLTLNHKTRDRLSHLCLG